MNDNKERNTITFLALQILLIVIKVTNLVNWSWWVILAPMLIVFGLGVILVLVAIILVFKEISKTRRK